MLGSGDEWRAKALKLEEAAKVKETAGRQPGWKREPEGSQAGEAELGWDPSLLMLGSWLAARTMETSFNSEYSRGYLGVRSSFTCVCCHDEG